MSAPQTRYLEAYSIQILFLINGLLVLKVIFFFAQSFVALFNTSYCVFFKTHTGALQLALLACLTSASLG